MLRDVTPSPAAPTGRGTRVALAVAALGLAVAAADLLLIGGGPVATEDAFWHVATGRVLWAEGGRPAGDPFAFTSGDRPWPLHEWSFHLLAAGADALAGTTGLRLLGVGLWIGAFAAWTWGIRRVTRDPAVACAVAGLLLAWLRHRVQIRPEAWSVAAMGCLLPACLDPGWTWTRGRLAVLAVGMVAWINVHSLALLGPVFLLGAAASQALARLPGARRAGGAAALAAAATLVSPEPLGPLRYALAARHPSLAFVVDEWQTILGGPGPGLATAGYVAIVVATVLFATGLGARLANPVLALPDARVGLVPALLGAAASLPARRFAWLWSLAALHGARRLAAACAGRTDATRAFPIGFALLAAGLAVAEAGPSLWLRRHVHFAEPYDAKFPAAAVARLREAGLPANVWAPYGAGGFVRAVGGPHLRVFIDGRTLQYEPAIFQAHASILLGGPDREELLARYAVDVVLATPSFLGNLDPARWPMAWRDDRTCLYVRSGRPDLLAALRGPDRTGR